MKKIIFILLACLHLVGFSQSYEVIQHPTETGEASPYGPNLVDADASAGDVCDQWTAYGSNTVTCAAGVIIITYIDSGFGARMYMRDTEDLTTNLTVGITYIMRLYMKVEGDGFNLKIEANPDVLLGVTNTDYEWIGIQWECTHATNNYFLLNAFGAGDVLHIDQWEVREVL